MTNPFTDYGTQKWQKGMCAVCWRERSICAAKTPHAQLSPVQHAQENMVCVFQEVTFNFTLLPICSYGDAPA